jgi:PD-(D/E)XK nuclease superfamily
MPIPKSATQNKPITAWSISRYNLYQKCPFLFACDHVWKIPNFAPKSPALENGARVHDVAKDYLMGLQPKMPVELKLQAPIVKRLVAKRKKDPASVIVEEQWGFTQKWAPIDYYDWKNCYLRVKVDAAERTGDLIEINDWKTGKFREADKAQYEEQLHLYGVTTLATYADQLGLKVRARLVYLDTNVIYPPPIYQAEYTQKDRPAMQRDWERKIRPMFSDKVFPPRPQFLCRFCDRRKEAGGPCLY